MAAVLKQRLRDPKAFRKTLIIVEHKSDIRNVEFHLKKACEKAGLDETIWAFDASPTTSANFQMLQLLLTTENSTHRSYYGRNVITIVIAHGPDTVGVTFWNRCFVMMTYTPKDLRELIQNSGRSVRNDTNDQEDKIDRQMAWANPSTKMP